LDNNLKSATTQFASTPSGRLGFRRLGPSGTVPLVLCHRFRGTIDDWDPAFLTVLVTEREVVVFDGVGVGYSSGEVPSTVTQMSTSVLELASVKWECHQSPVIRSDRCQPSIKRFRPRTLDPSGSRSLSPGQRVHPAR
jgi:pimeloyl-ACP methyl ester carboxylesterase